MSKLTMKDVSAALKKLDVCMMTTQNATGMLESRPMSNNRDVDYNGDSYFFTLDKMSCVSDLRQRPEICLVYEGRRNLFAPHLYICVSGHANLVTERAVMERHWQPSMEKWFANGLDTPGITLIHVRAAHINYWDGFDEGEVAVPLEEMRLAG